MSSISHPYQISFRLNNHLESASSSQHVLACDIPRNDGSISKCFTIIDSVTSEVGRKQLVNLMNSHGNHWYEILRENVPTRIFVDIETSNGDYNKVKKAVEDFIGILTMWCKEGNLFDGFTMLDSSNSKKVSFHIIGGCYLRNSYNVGALMRRLIHYIYSLREVTESKQTFDVENFFDNDNNFIIDEQIYTRNRQFRLAEQSKMGSNRVLNGTDVFSSFLQVPNVVNYRSCLELDKSEPESTSKRALDLFINIDGDWVKKVVYGSSSLKTIKSEMPDTLSQIRIYLENWLGEGRITGSSFDIVSGSWRLTTSCQICKIAGRRHAHNHIWLYVNPWRMKCYQKCFDENCRGEFDISIPDDYWLKWQECTKKTVGIDVEV